MASIVSQSDQNGPKWVQKGSKRGVPKWVPQGSEPEKSRKIFFLWPQSTKKVTRVPVFEEKKIFLRKKKEEKTALQGGVVPQGATGGGPLIGDCMGGVVP